MSLVDDLASPPEDPDLRRANLSLLRQLEKSKASRDELVAAVYQAAHTAASAMTIPPVPVPKADRRKASPEVAICLLADWQAGKVTKLIELQRAHHPVNEAHIFLLGDLLEGEEIFPGQAHRIDASLYMQLFSTANLLAEVVRSVAATVPKVVVRGAIGNHGALGGPIRRAYHPETNADAMLYNIARLQLRDEPRVEWAETLVAGERAWFATDLIFDKRWFLAHMDQVKSASFGIPWYGFQKRLLGWATSVTPFDYAVGGHWHQSVRFNVNALTYWGAGSIESANTYAQEWLASGGQRPSQWLLFQGQDGVTAEYCVYVD